MDDDEFALELDSTPAVIPCPAPRQQVPRAPLAAPHAAPAQAQPGRQSAQDAAAYDVRQSAGVFAGDSDSEWAPCSDGADANGTPQQTAAQPSVASTGDQHHAAGPTAAAGQPLVSGQQPAAKPSAVWAQGGPSQLDMDIDPSPQPQLRPPHQEEQRNDPQPPSGNVQRMQPRVDPGQPMLTLTGGFAARRGGSPPAKQLRMQPPPQAQAPASRQPQLQLAHLAHQMRASQPAPQPPAQPASQPPAACRSQSGAAALHHSQRPAGSASATSQPAVQSQQQEKAPHSGPAAAGGRPSHASELQHQRPPSQLQPSQQPRPLSRQQVQQRSQQWQPVPGPVQSPEEVDPSQRLLDASQAQPQSQYDNADPTRLSQPGLAAQAAPIPGPAGVLQRQTASGAMPSTLADVVGPSQAAARACRTGTGQSADPDFLSEAWRSALDVLDLLHFDESSPLLRHTVQRVLAMAEACIIPRMLVLVVSATTVASGEGQMIVKDPTGRMGGCLNRAVMAGEDCPKPGAVLMLQQVPLLPLGFGGPSLLCVTPESVAQVLPPDPDGLPSQAGTAVVAPAPSQQLVVASSLAMQQQQRACAASSGGRSGGGQGLNPSARQPPSQLLRLEGPAATQRTSQQLRPSAQHQHQQQQGLEDPAAAQERQRQAARRTAAEQYALARSQASAQRPPAPHSGSSQRPGSSQHQPAIALPGSQGQAAFPQQTATCSQHGSDGQRQASAGMAAARSDSQRGAAEAPLALPLGPPRPVFADATNAGAATPAAAAPQPIVMCQQPLQHFSFQSAAPDDSEDTLLDGLDDF